MAWATGAGPREEAGVKVAALCVLPSLAAFEDGLMSVEACGDHTFRALLLLVAAEYGLITVAMCGDHILCVLPSFAADEDGLWKEATVAD